MTDTKHISDAIDGLPDDNTRVATLNDLDGFPDTEIGTVADLKALVAENEALKEQVDGLKKNISTGRKAVRVLLGLLDMILPPHTATWNAGKAIAKDWLEATHGGNDD